MSEREQLIDRAVWGGLWDQSAFGAKAELFCMMRAALNGALRPGGNWHRAIIGRWYVPNNRAPGPVPTAHLDQNPDQR